LQFIGYAGKGGVGKGKRRNADCKVKLHGGQLPVFAKAFLALPGGWLAAWRTSIPDRGRKETAWVVVRASKYQCQLKAKS